MLNTKHTPTTTKQPIHNTPPPPPHYTLSHSHVACLYGSEGCARRLLDAGARADAVNAEDGTTPLHDAAAGGYAGIMRLVADAARGQLKGKKGGGGGGAGAAAAAEEEGAEKEGADGAAIASLADLVNFQDSEGETALHNAARGGHAEAVRLLLSLGADPFLAANDGRLAYEEAEDDGVAAIVREAMGDEGEDEGEDEEGEDGAGEGGEGAAAK